jgi:hypothetical protein
MRPSVSSCDGARLPLKVREPTVQRKSDDRRSRRAHAGLAEQRAKRRRAVKQRRVGPNLAPLERTGS